MSWVYSDDKSPHHPKLIRAGAEAAWLWHSAICYSNAHALDGVIARDLLSVLYPPLASKAGKLAAKLVSVGLLHDHGDHFEIHDYKDWQQRALKAEVEIRREYERNRKREQRKPPGQTSEFVPDIVPDTSRTKLTPVPSVSRYPIPSLSRPDPIPTERESDARAILTDLTREAHVPSIGDIRQALETGFKRRFAKLTTAAVPITRANTDAFAAVSAWCRDTAAARESDAIALVDALLKAFFASAKAKENGFKITWLAQNPMEFLEPVADRRPGDDSTNPAHRMLE